MCIRDRTDRHYENNGHLAVNQYYCVSTFLGDFTYNEIRLRTASTKNGRLEWCFQYSERLKLRSHRIKPIAASCVVFLLQYAI